jgi:hypothetical protein
MLFWEISNFSSIERCVLHVSLLPKAKMLPPLVILVGTWSFSDTVVANYWSLYFESLNITSRNLIVSCANPFLKMDRADTWGFVSGGRCLYLKLLLCL